jgi:hypothetical protein
VWHVAAEGPKMAVVLGLSGSEPFRDLATLLLISYRVNVLGLFINELMTNNLNFQEH